MSYRIGLIRLFPLAQLLSPILLFTCSPGFAQISQDESSPTPGYDKAKMFFRAGFDYGLISSTCLQYRVYGGSQVTIEMIENLFRTAKRHKASWYLVSKKIEKNGNLPPLCKSLLKKYMS